jgi:hypothetical protein
MATCSLQTYYCADNPIIENVSILYSNNTSPLSPVGAGFYATEVGTGSGTVYETDSSGKVISILDANDTSCSNVIVPTYKYYEARRYNCGDCGNQKYITYVAVNSMVSLTIDYYYTTGPNSNSNSPVYKIKDGPFNSITEPHENTVDSSRGASICERSCYGNNPPPQV